MFIFVGLALLCVTGSAVAGGVKCGVSPAHQSRIIGGVNAIPGAWPWIASFQYKGKHFCGATLLTPTWVVTASHCVEGIKSKDLHYYSMKLGTHDHRVVEPSAQRVGIKRYIQHPDWDRQWMLGDITMVELSEPVTLNKRVNVPCLPKEGVYPKLGKECMLAGWGSIETKGRPYHTLQQVKLPVVKSIKCKHHDESVCVGLGFGKLPSGKQKPNACRGDSGGPLVCQRADGTWQLDGVASFVWTYCKYFTAYSPVNKYLPWIKKYIKS